MIGYGADGSQGPSNPNRNSDLQGGARLSNFRSEANMGQVPQVEAEESVGKQTEDFGGYALDEDNRANSGSHPLGGYERVEDSGLEKSAMKQRAQINIPEASPIHLSQGSIEANQPNFGSQPNGDTRSQNRVGKRNSMGVNSQAYSGYSQFDEK